MGKLKVLDLFSGIGGFSYGLEKTGLFNGAAFCEIEEHCLRVLKKNFNGAEFFEDIKNLNVEEGEFDVMTGGFPCQDISIAGKNAGIGGEKSGLWKEYKRLIKEGKPKYAIIENVSALLSRGLSTVLQDLGEIGYDATWTTYDTKYFGKPQRRRRVYIVAIRDGIPSGSDLFENGLRDSEVCRRKVELINKSFRWDFKKGGGDEHSFAFITRQRSNEFKEIGLSGTLAKRDYKSFTDLVIQNGSIRRVTPKERLNLQGFPPEWLDGCELSDKEKFSCNGMSVPVVAYIGRLVFKFDVRSNNTCNADFYADGKYRFFYEGTTESFFVESGNRFKSIFSFTWMKRMNDYVDLKALKNENT